MVLYESTRGAKERITSSNAILRGIAPDGGLYVPDFFAKFSVSEIEEMVNKSYNERAYMVLSRLLDDFSKEELTDCIKNAYNENKFISPDIAPVKYLHQGLYILELWHGPTCAFKDMALQILPHFLVRSIRKNSEKCEIIILVATSGDTGKAALEGFADVEGTRIMVFYPENGVSEIQKYQMVTQTGKNVKVIGVNGNFDHAQTGVKTIFTDQELINDMQANKMKFSSANSINWGRLAPQIVYYFSAYAELVKNQTIKAGDKINFVVPTGNFGNILAGYYAKIMGLPINRLICASNDNNVLTDFIITGSYDKRRKFVRTISPSMDILVSSNLERLLYEVSGRDSLKIAHRMKKLNEEGVYEISPKELEIIQEQFWAGWSNQDETLKTIECVYNDYKYLSDTHTAVGIDVYDKYVISTGDLTPSAIVSTASPFKFNESVCRALFKQEEINGKSEFELLNMLSEKTGLSVPSGLADLDKKMILHTTICEKDEMKDIVREYLSL
jgi:threonine synthase